MTRANCAVVSFTLPVAWRPHIEGALAAEDLDFSKFVRAAVRRHLATLGREVINPK